MLEQVLLEQEVAGQLERVQMVQPTMDQLGLELELPEQT
jgi:hypothetical protein